MDFTVDPADEAFRAELRAFIAENLPPDIAGRTRADFRPIREDVAAWTRILDAKGWSVPGWPVDYGGTGWSPLRRHIFLEECALADAPQISVFGLYLAGPVIYTFGSDEQKRRFLPGIRSGEEFWCQGFSEPEAGSDLASLRTSATLDGDEWVIDGRKIWTTHAHYADWMFCLARTDAQVKPQAGLSFFLIEMRSPGVEVRPIITIDRSHDVNEVVLDHVRIPAGNLVGTLNKGWDYAKFLLANERTFSAHVPKTKRALIRLKEIAHEEPKHGRPLIEDPVFRSKVAAAEIDLKALEFAVLRALADPDFSPAFAAMLKLRGSDLEQRMTSLTVEALGPRALRYWPDPSWSDPFWTAPDRETLPGEGDHPGGMGTHLFLRAASIYSGSNEIQRDLIARDILGK